MRIVEKFANCVKDNWTQPAVTLAFLGDSVTQGCFELYCKENGDPETIFEQNHAYHRYVAQILSMLYPNVPLNIINAGISGSNAPHGLERLERDVLSHRPDLVVVCFGLNDIVNGLAGLDAYLQALETIFRELEAAQVETIFLTPNMMNTYVSRQLTEPVLRKIAEVTCAAQNDGILDAYMDGAKALCRRKGITVCDCYEKWKTLQKCAVDTTMLLANHINHPSRDMNWLFAVSLVETMLGLPKTLVTQNGF